MALGVSSWWALGSGRGHVRVSHRWWRRALEVGVGLGWDGDTGVGTEIRGGGWEVADGEGGRLSRSWGCRVCYWAGASWA